MWGSSSNSKMLRVQRLKCGVLVASAVVLALLLTVPVPGSSVASPSQEDDSRTQVLRITSDVDTITFIEGAVPLGELAEDAEKEKDQAEEEVERAEAKKESKLKSGRRLEIEKKEPGSINIQIGDKYYNGKDLVRFGEPIEIDEGEEIGGDVVAIGGPITVRGKVSGDAVAIGGTLTITSTGIINGDAVAVGGTVVEEPGSTVEGDVVSMGNFVIPGWVFRGGFPTFAARFAGLTMLLVKSLIVILLAWLVVAIFGDRVKATAQTVVSRPFASFGMGLLIFILTPIAMVLLVITLIGIPVAIVLPFALALIILFGYTAVGLALGNKLVATQVLGSATTRATLLGVALIEAVPLVGKIIGLPGGFFSAISFPIKIVGYAVMACAIAIGLGAAILSRMGKPKQPASAVPPAPPQAPVIPTAGPAPGTSLGGAPPEGS